MPTTDSRKPLWMLAGVAAVAASAFALAAVGPGASAAQLPQQKKAAVVNPLQKKSNPVANPLQKKAGTGNPVAKKAGTPAAKKAEVPVRNVAGAARTRSQVAQDFSAQQCGFCHKPSNASAPEVQPQLIRFEEFKIWDEQDKHSFAFASLQSDRGKRMTELLGRDVTTDKACLACHAPAVTYATEDTLAGAKAEGVGCTACHADGQNPAWITEHSRRRAWGKLTIDEKEAAGFRALRRPERRSEVCLSCHLGNAEEGKILTHEMYAAGHPPLPGIEAATFSTDEPPHWWLPKDVPAFKDADIAAALRSYGLDEASTLRANFAVPEEGTPVRTQLALTNAAVALREAAELVRDFAKDQAIVWDQKPGWPEFATFECYACHHDLNAPGYREWRQVRGFAHRLEGQVLAAPAGRPQIRPWPNALVGAAAMQGGVGPEWESSYFNAMRDLFNATDRTPFGNADEVGQAAGAVAAQADVLVKAIGASKFDRAAIPGLLRKLATIGPNEFPDYDSARQIFWAFQMLYEDIDPPGTDAAIRELLAQVGQSLKGNPFATAEQFAQINEAVSVEDRQDEEKVKAADDQLRALSAEELETSLSAAASYSPVTFKATMAQIVNLLP